MTHQYKTKIVRSNKRKNSHSHSSTFCARKRHKKSLCNRLNTLSTSYACKSTSNTCAYSVLTAAKWLSSKVLQFLDVRKNVGSSSRSTWACYTSWKRSMMRLSRGLQSSMPSIRESVRCDYPHSASKASPSMNSSTSSSSPTLLSHIWCENKSRVPVAWLNNRCTSCCELRNYLMSATPSAKRSSICTKWQRT